jgi:hypothetical protein
MTMARWITGIVVAGSLFAVPPVQGDLLTNLQGYWQFNYDGTDSSGNSRDVTLVGSAGIGAGIFGNGLALSNNVPGASGAANGWAERGPDSVFDFGTGDFGMQVWAKYADVSAEQVLMEQFTGGGGPGWTLTSALPGYGYLFWDGSGATGTGTPPTQGNWNHIVVNRSGGVTDLYVNGSLAATGGAGTIGPATYPLLLGRRNAGDGRPFAFNGTMDEVAIWNRSLTTQEISTLYNNGTGTEIVADPLPANLDRGHRLLIQRGYQLHGVAFLGSRATNPYPDDPVDLSVLNAANFNGIHFGSANWTDVMWTQPTGNYNWSRWSANPNMTPYTPYDAAGMVMASAVDELDISSASVRADYAAWLADMRTLMPQVISHTTQIGWQPSLATLQTYMAQAQPDMLFFDDYSFPDTLANAPAGGSPTNWYKTLGKYRIAARAGNDGTGTAPIPAGLWIQTYKRDGYVLSESQLSLQYGAAWAYGYKSIFSFTYGTTDPNNAVASVFFGGPNDTNPTPLYYSVAELNRQTLNLGPSLLKLKSENILFVRGKHKNQFNQTVTNALPQYAGQWSSSADPYMKSIVVTNDTAGTTKNDGLPGDLLIGYFKPLHEDFDGPGWTDELYFLITNGLSDPTGDKYDTRQLVRLNFDFGNSGITNLLRRDRDTGQVVVQNLTHVRGHKYYLDWYLYGGEGDLFKYNTGAPFVNPEPGTIAMLSLGVLALLRRRPH